MAAGLRVNKFATVLFLKEQDHPHEEYRVKQILMNFGASYQSEPETWSLSPFGNQRCVKVPPNRHFTGLHAGSQSVCFK